MGLQLTKGNDALPIITSTNLNTLIVPGGYTGYNLVNSPDTANWCYVEVKGNGSDQVVQELRQAAYAGGAVWTRESVNGGTSWSAWSGHIFPTGTIMLFGNTSAPAGFLKCNGATLSRTTYAALFSAIGTVYGAGDGSTTFSIPDFRGEFLRGWDDGRGVDSGRGIGTNQSQSWKTFWINEVGFGWSGGYSHGVGEIPMSAENGYWGAEFTGMWSNPSAAQSYRYGTQEVRPRNSAILVCIKY